MLGSLFKKNLNGALKPASQAVQSTKGKRGGAARTIKADYWKMGTANFVFHTNDGYAATAVIEYEEV